MKSEKRVSSNRKYQKFLHELSQKSDANEEEVEIPEEDFSMAEAINIVKDMVIMKEDFSQEYPVTVEMQ